MPRRDDLHSILIIGAGPIVIGQACEFDYSGVQAVKALKEEGYRVILVNSNPATIMTDPGLADATYIEPITPEFVAQIIAQERPDALLPTMGGQTALNVGLALARDGTLEKYGVELIGAREAAIEMAEDRLKFRDAMDRIGLQSPRSRLVTNLDEALEALGQIGLPIISRPSFTLGGEGGGIAYNREEFAALVERGLRLSPASEVLIEESVLGWKEFEMEVVRDRVDNAIIVCSIENLDPMGIHTGDSITIAPALTLTDKEYQILRNASLAVLREIGVDTGGSNVQFAINPQDGRLVVIEMNPRVSRSSALASKATGFPIAKVAAKLAVGYRLDEVANEITGGRTPASFEPSIDYIVTKIPRFAFEKFPGADPLLSTAMKSVGEVMSMGRSFAESLQKALVSLEVGLSGLDEVALPEDEELALAALRQQTPLRLLRIAQAFRRPIAFEAIQSATHFDPWFLAQIEALVAEETQIKAEGLPSQPQALHRLKRLGFSDARLAKLSGATPPSLPPVYKRIDTCAGEFDSSTAYFYSTHEGEGSAQAECEADPSEAQKVMVLGGGPNRIGQGIEFDYCCVHAAYALRDAGYEVIMVNCNPETVSTDYDTSDRLYFEPLTAEHVVAIARKEQERGKLLGAIVQFGGQTPLNLANALQQAGIPILGTAPDAIDLAEDRERFQTLVQDLGLRQPANGTAQNLDEVQQVAAEIGFPLLLRPSYVLGGRAMELVQDRAGLERHAEAALEASGSNPVLLDSFLVDAIELDVDAICDGKTVYIAGLMEHIEEAGVHSGDSACVLPPRSLSLSQIAEIERQTRALALALQVRGLMNVQFAVHSGEIYLLEVNPRASRTVPFVAKATGIAVARIAARVMAGETLPDAFKIESGKAMAAPKLNHVAVKEAVFPFDRFPGVDVLLGPEMRSTGEVMGLARDFGSAFYKAQRAAGNQLPQSGQVFISIRDHDKSQLGELGRDLVALGFTLLATDGTAEALTQAGLQVARVNKVYQGSPHIVDAMRSNEVALVINTVEGAKASHDSRSLRQTALRLKIPYTTTLSGAFALVKAMRARNSQASPSAVLALQDYIG